MLLENLLRLKDTKLRYPIIQGGMGAGVSLYRLASAVGKKGGMGTISSVGLEQFTRARLLKQGEKVKDETPKKINYIEATEREIYDTKKEAGLAAINIMCALPLFYEKAVEGAVRGGVDMIISGAGLPIELRGDNSVDLPFLVRKYAGKDHNINLVPIVSSALIFNKLCKSWARQGYRPDAVVLEGPKAGGHIGWSYKRVERSENFLEEYDLFDKLLDPVLGVADKYKNDFGPIPVFVAGGIFTHKDILYALDRGAAGVQMGSRFAVTDESGFSDESKDIIINAKKEDIVIADQVWGSPCKFPFRYVKTSPLAKEKKGNYFCICSTLLAAAGIDNTKLCGTKGFPKRCPEKYALLDKKALCPATNTVSYKSLVTCGSEAYRIKRELSVKELMDELIGLR